MMIVNKRLLRWPAAALAVCAPLVIVAQETTPAASVAPVVPPASLEGAPIALMEDVGSGRTLFARETDRRFIPASLTKLMTVYTAFELLEEGRITPEQRFGVRAETAQKWAGRGSSMFVDANDRISVDELLAGIVTVSANDGTIVLAEGVAGSVEGFTRIMNAKARELGMADSHFNTPNGWPDEGRTYTSARDLAKLATALVAEHPEKYQRYFGIPEFTWNDITQKNRNPILGFIPGADGLKTGFTNEAGYGFVGSAERDGRRLIMVIGNTESSRERKAIARDFIEWGFNAWSAQELYAKGSTIGSAQVQGGAETEVALRTAQPVLLTTPMGTSVRPGLSIRYIGPVAAPIAEGQRIAELRVAAGGANPRAIPLFAAEAVPEANWWQRLRNGLVGIFR